ncbi:hypothetical protein Bca4012_026538 [Brassica carinata]
MQDSHLQGGLSASNEEREDGGEERRGGSDCLVERDGNVTRRSVAHTMERQKIAERERERNFKNRWREDHANSCHVKTSSCGEICQFGTATLGNSYQQVLRSVFNDTEPDRATIVSFKEILSVFIFGLFYLLQHLSIEYEELKWPTGQSTNTEI